MDAIGRRKARLWPAPLRQHRDRDGTPGNTSRGTSSSRRRFHSGRRGRVCTAVGPGTAPFVLPRWPLVTLALAIVAGTSAIAAWKVSGIHQLHALEAREDDPNPIAARHLPTIRPSHTTPVPFVRYVVDGRTFDNGRKPKVIIDPDGRGAVVGAQIGPLGFALYPPGRPPVVISHFSENAGSEDAQAADLEGTGAPDIVVGGLADLTYVLRNPRNTGCGDVYRCSWPVTVIDRAHASHDVVVGDVDRDGRIDVVTESGIYFNNGRGKPWTFVGRSAVPRDGEGTALGDVVGDGIPDIFAPYRSGTMFARFVNPLHTGGDPRRDPWKVQIIDAHPRFNGNMTTAIFDVDGNGRRDLVMAPMYGGGGLVWYRAPHDPNGAWTRHLIDPSVNFVHQNSLRPADFNGNGRDDIAFAEQDQSPTKRVGVFYNLDGGRDWHLQVLATNGGHNIKVGVLAGDRSPSILTARHGYFGGPNPLVTWRDRRG